MTAEGGVAKDNQDRTDGSWNQNVGAAKEAVGGFTGIESLKQQGAQQNKEGKEQEAAGQVSDLGEGLKNRVGGNVGAAVAGLTGNGRLAAARRHAGEHQQGRHRRGLCRALERVQ